ncbi:DNA-directed RNA polymerase sigma subunit (RpoD) [Plesiocystis pacifica SIR-1]|uniref:DNA-directed RNA polymerase sigma subunit (RpoD) n=1 Tax=Plesiocystis pacifica SIR-1 TaxID=391625 RepID=A6FXT2_9BACT|nr:sigma-70 family RNA polymerase sigma factor [Plesiocystis pacifica]EDM81670.1 DNA-directed RNA polymerase sigma subunit (RpoD) [Plesiocystis pacifica SIR-1]
MTESRQRAVARVVELRGFAWHDEPALEPADEGTPLLDENGQQLGCVAVPDDAPSSEFSMADGIVALDSATRTRLFETLNLDEIELIRTLLTTVDEAQEQWLLEVDARIDSNLSSTLEESDLPGLSRRERAEISMRVARYVLAGDIDFGPEVRAMLDRILATRRRLFADSLRLVISLVHRYRKHMDFATGMLRGALGLDKAIDRFEPERGWQFSTYATWWIRQNITRSSMDFATALRVPVHAAEQTTRFWMVQQELWSQTGVRPTDEEVLNQANFKFSIERLGDYRRHARTAHLTRRDQLGAAEAILDSDIPSLLEGNPASGWVRAAIDHATAQVDDKEHSRPSRGRWHAIFSRRILGDQIQNNTLRELGEEFDITRERIRQNEAKLIDFLARRLFRGQEHLPPLAWGPSDE